MDIREVLRKTVETVRKMPETRFETGEFKDSNQFLQWLENQEEQAAINLINVWTPEDVKSLPGCENMTDEEAGNVLEKAEHRFDACIGINWDVLADAASEFLGN